MRQLLYKEKKGMKKRIISTLLLIAMVFQVNFSMGQKSVLKAESLESTDSSETTETVENEGKEIIEAENITIDGHQYKYVKYVINKTKNTICVTSMKTRENQLIIPAKINGIPVVEIAAENSNYTLRPWNIDETQVLDKVIVSEGIKIIKGYGFLNLKAKYVEVPKSLTWLGEDSFSECFYCAEIEHVKLKGKGTAIGVCAFQYSKVKKITLPSKYKGRIYSSAFKKSDIEEFKWPSGNGSIKVEDGTFSNCKKLRKVVFPKNQKHIKISLGSFYGCSKLKKLTFPASTKKVTYLWTPHADNYKKSVNVLEFKGKNTRVVGIKNRKKKNVLTVGKIVAPKNSKALKYAKKAKRVKYLSKWTKKEIEGDASYITDFVSGDYHENSIKYAKMKYSVLKKK